MGRKEKGRRYLVEPGNGVEITRQPEKPDFSYGYRVLCAKCNQASAEREGHIDPKSLQCGMMGRHECEFCGRVSTFVIQETQQDAVRR